ncbi:scavenger mRNA decapping enzyme [Wolfiporia cocos MD-104 SS10]|uniref:Scavenger mRNA decapping enzyme n=1 Tax=Wolfiporia cocos (strain MD-104) TaxID=742152 RepID=A0A2H3JHY4_WOLCO|nr:scavenger mRNA decapping enzyme [Wolfiporia cocos MD-104 SS10]
MAASTHHADMLRNFRFERVLNEDAITSSLVLLGSIPTASHTNGTEQRAPAIARIERGALPPALSSGDLVAALRDTQLVLSNDIYASLHGWLAPSEDRPDVKIGVIFPATDVHIRKYSAQRYYMVRETPALYERIVKPYIAAFPPARTQWVVDILEGRAEADKVLHSDPAYVLLPDIKWDLATIASLYLVAIAKDGSIRSLRDLRKHHLGMLRSIRRESARVARQRWGLGRGALRMYVHYQPSYYHFHVHVVNVEHTAPTGMSVGQAHLLDDIISLLESDVDDGPSVFERMTLTYALGEQHGLFEPLRAAQEAEED